MGSRPAFTLYRARREIEGARSPLKLRASDATISQQNRQLWPGMSVYPLTDDRAEDLGLSPAKASSSPGVDQGSPADIGGVIVYDVVRCVNGEPVDSALDFYATIADLKRRDSRMGDHGSP